MKKRNVVVLILLLLFTAKASVCAQSIATDSVRAIPEIKVVGNRLEEFNAGVKTTTYDSTTGLQNYANLAGFLNQNSTIYLKTYGLGSLATTSFRGASTSQTSILWNGFNLQSPMNGVVDLSLIPTSFLEQLKIQFGGCGGMWGSGSVSGTIHLENRPSFGTGLSLRYSGTMGSFSSRNHTASIGYSTKKWILSAKLLYTQAKNNFPFRNTTQFNSPQQIQSNAAVSLGGYMVEGYYKLSPRSQVNVRVWEQHSKRYIPPSMLSDSSDAVQSDWFIRMSSEFQHSRVKSTWNIRAAYFDENILFREKSSAIDAYSRSQLLIGEAEGKYSIGKFMLFNLGLNDTYSTAHVSDYNGLPNQNRLALFSSLKYSNRKATISGMVGGRQEIVNGTRFQTPLLVPIMPFAGGSLAITSKVLLKVNLSRNYRLPTFNDLYWTPGGNPLLKPEQGWSEEIGVQHTNARVSCKEGTCKPDSTKRFVYTLTCAGFNRVIDNWIMWTPVGSYWEPQNLLKVWSRGLETSAGFTWKINQVELNTTLHYDYVLSTNLKVAAGNETDLDKQLIYVPLHKGGVQAAVTYRTYRFNYTHHYTGWVYTQSDNEAFINAYWIGSAHLSKEFKFAKLKFQAHISCANIFNQEYQVIAYRPMPGRSYELGVIVHFTNKQ